MARRTICVTVRVFSSIVAPSTRVMIRRSRPPKESSMSVNKLAKAMELREKTATAYHALTSGMHSGVTAAQSEQLLKAWEAAHRAWWDEIQRVTAAG